MVLIRYICNMYNAFLSVQMIQHLFICIFKHFFTINSMRIKTNVKSIFQIKRVARQAEYVYCWCSFFLIGSFVFEWWENSFDSCDWLRLSCFHKLKQFYVARFGNCQSECQLIVNNEKNNIVSIFKMWPTYLWLSFQ